MQVQRQDPGMAALLAKLLPMIGQTAGTAMGGPMGGALGGVGGAGLESMFMPRNQEPMMLGQQGMQQAQSDQGPGAMQNMLAQLLGQLREYQAQPDITPQATEETQGKQANVLEKFLDKMSGNGKQLMIKYLQGIAANQLAGGQ